jgi:hypothetical protein
MTKGADYVKKIAFRRQDLNHRREPKTAKKVESKIESGGETIGNPLVLPPRSFRGRTHHRCD